jgi:DNA-binding protein YbaB
MSDIGAAEEWLDAWTASVNDRARAAADLAQRVSQLTGTATNRHRSVRVTVDSTGAVQSIEVDDRIREMTGREIGREIMAAIRSAQANLAGTVAAAVEETVGSDTETGRAVVDSFATRFPQPPRSELPEADRER